MISSQILASLIVSAVLAALWPVAVFVICRRRMTLSAWNMLVGAAVFFIFSQMLEKILHGYVLKGNPGTAAWLHAHPFMLALYGCLAAALFEETGRYLGMRLLVRNTGDPGTAVAYGLGHGGLEALLIGTLAMAQAYIFASMLNAGRLETVLGPSLTPDAVQRLRSNLEQLSVASIALATTERLIALLIQIGLSILVWRAVEKQRLRYLGLAFLLHALVDYPAGLFQAGQLSLLAVEVMLGLVGLGLAALFLIGLPKRKIAGF